MSEVSSFCTVPDPNSNLYRAVNGDWALQHYMLADLIDLQTLMLWFQTEDGVKNHNRPKPYPRPNPEPDTAPTTAEVLGKTADIMSIEEYKKRMSEIGHHRGS